MPAAPANPATPATPVTQASPVIPAFSAAGPQRPGHAPLRKRSTKAASGGRHGRGGASGAHYRTAPRSRAAGPEPTPREPGALTPEIEAELAEVAAAAGCELIHVEWKGGVLRLVLDRPPAPQTPPQSREPSDGSGSSEPAAGGDPSDPAGPSEGRVPRTPMAPGVSLANCEQVAKQSSALLDVLDFGRGRYLLEVSSPGLDRQLYRLSDYERFLGRLARVTYETTGPGGGPARRTVVARLAELRRPAIGTETPPAVSAAGPRALTAAGEVTLIDDKTGQRLTLKLESIRLARLEVEL
jgi:ribosome maturation factor RimP